METLGCEIILVDVQDGVATLTLNRPETLNAMNHQMAREFKDAMWALERDEQIRAIVVTGAGRGFCSGIDIKGRGEAFGSQAHGKTEADRAAGVDAQSIAEEHAFWRMRTPVIAAINGPAIGAGLTLPLLFDVCFVAEDATLAFPFSRLGICAEANSTWLLPRMIGVNRALELLLSGRRFTGREAADIGLVARALPAVEVLHAAKAFARDIADNTAPLSVALIKRLTYQFLGENDRTAAFELETDATWWAGDLPDAREGVLAYLAKRPPEWNLTKHHEFSDQLKQSVTRF